LKVGSGLGTLANGGSPGQAIKAGVGSGIFSLMRPGLEKLTSFTINAVKSTISGAGKLVGAIASDVYGQVQGLFNKELGPIAKDLLKIAMKPITIPTAFILDTIYGPVGEMTITTYDAQARHLYIDQRIVKAYRLNEELVFSYVPGENEIHVGVTTFRALRGDFGLNWQNRAISHIAHEIGHTYQAREWGLLYWGTVVPLTFPANALKMVGINNFPIIRFFENNATNRGRYVGVK